MCLDCLIYLSLIVFALVFVFVGLVGVLWVPVFALLSCLFGLICCFSLVWFLVCFVYLLFRFCLLVCVYSCYVGYVWCLLLLIMFVKLLLGMLVVWFCLI